jgi:hypothetical protein
MPVLTEQLTVETPNNISTPQVLIIQTAFSDFARIRLTAGSAGNPPVNNGFWDIAVGPSGNDNLNIFSQLSTNNLVSLSASQQTVTINGNLQCTGVKNFVQPHPSNPGQEVVFTALEGSEAGVYCRGRGKVVDGTARIALPEAFRLVASVEDLTAHLTPRGSWLQLYVAALDANSIVIEEAQGKSGEFDYVVHGIRKGYEQQESIRDKR